MKTTPAHDERIAKMTFASVYPHYVAKVERKGRTKNELHQVIEWLTGFDENKLQKLIDEEVTFKTFFERAEDIEAFLQIWEQMKAKSFLNYNVDIKKQDEHLEELKP